MRRLMLGEKEDDEMGQWELIADITLEETEQNISITKDVSGNPFRLKSVEIFVISAPSEYSSAASISACLTAARLYPVFIGYAALATEQKRYCYGLWEKTSFGVFHKLSLHSNNGSSDISSMYKSSNSGQAFTEEGATCPDVCEGIWIGSHYQNVLPAGTKIEIYGIRE